MSTFLAALILAMGLLTAPDTTKRPCVEVRINDQPARLAIDTCAERLVLFSPSADRLGLKYRKPQGFDPNTARPGRVTVFRSEVCRLEVGNQGGRALKIDEAEGRRRIRILDMPPGFSPAGVDGLLGWSHIARNILHIDWARQTFESLPAVPGGAGSWREFKLHSPFGLHVLAVQVPTVSGPKKAVYLDTGHLCGVQVSSALWEEIVAQHLGLPMAIEGWYTPAAGSVLHRVCWLKTLKLGEIEMHDVPVSEMPQALQGLPSCLALIGLYGLTRLEVIVDDRHHRAHLRTRQSYSKRYDYNRSGVVFLPVNNQSSDLVATVLESGPAYEAGLRNGDRLLRINGRDVTGWRDDPNGMTEGRSPFAQPAGTKVNLTVQREGQPLDVTILLKELLLVEAPPAFPQQDEH